MQVVPTAGRAVLTPFEDAVDRLELAVAAPTVIQRLLSTLADPRSSIRDVQDVLKADVALVTRVLKLASSAAYSRGPVRDLASAIQTVGLEQLRRLAVTAHFATGQSPLARALWSYSLAVAFTSAQLAKASRLAPGPDPFLCGLLHDIGTLVFERLLKARYTGLAIVPGDEQQCTVEQGALGFDHTDLGAMAVARWNLFPELELVVQLHHTPLIGERLGLPAPTQAVIELVALARLATLTAHGTLGDDDLAALELRADLCERRGVSAAHALVCAGEGLAQAGAALSALS